MTTTSAAISTKFYFLVEAESTLVSDGMSYEEFVSAPSEKSYSDFQILGTHSKGLIWLKNEAGQHFPNHLIRKGTKSILLYSHGNGGSLGDFKSITFFYAQWYVVYEN